MVQKYKALIVDDEAEARDLLENLLLDLEDVEVVAKAESVDEALHFILTDEPDLIFLDIEMPGKDGFDLISEMRNYNVKAEIIFVTAFNKYAIKAIKASAFDYLLKPVDPEELLLSFVRFKNEQKEIDFREKIEGLFDALKSQSKIRFNFRSESIYVDPSEIIYIRAEGNYSVLYLENGGSETITNNIGKLEELLQCNKFIRISRSVIINKDFPAKIDRKQKRCYLLNNDIDYQFSMSNKRMKNVNL